MLISNCTATNKLLQEGSIHVFDTCVPRINTVSSIYFAAFHSKFKKERARKRNQLYRIEKEAGYLDVIVSHLIFIITTEILH